LIIDDFRVKTSKMRLYSIGYLGLPRLTVEPVYQCAYRIYTLFIA
jgi:hypothetical protein